MKEMFTITYTFSLNQSQQITIPIEIDEENLLLLNRPSQNSDWCKLEFMQCPNCPLSTQHVKYCPAATAIQDLIDHFRNTVSFDECYVEVQVKERTYSKKTSFQEALRSILGIYMPVSGCPNLAWLKPMARFHLPFSSTKETLFRVVGTYLTGQYVRQLNGEEADLNLKGLKLLYEKVHTVNIAFSARLRSAINKDAAANSLVILDIFSQSVPFSIDRSLSELSPFFKPYL
ncbi:MAG: hypothetical protein Kow00108_08490 [Calditrichia bacterium]